MTNEQPPTSESGQTSESPSERNVSLSDKWLEKEAMNDDELLKLIYRREAIGMLLARREDIDDDNRPVLQKNFEDVLKEISQRKQELGINPTEEP